MGAWFLQTAQGLRLPDVALLARVPKCDGVEVALSAEPLNEFGYCGSQCLGKRYNVRRGCRFPTSVLIVSCSVPSHIFDLRETLRITTN